MGVVYNENINHFNYYLAVESDLINTFRYVECSKSNDNTFSVEFARIIMKWFKLFIVKQIRCN